MKIVDVIWRKPVSTYAISACEALVASVNSVKKAMLRGFYVGKIRRISLSLRIGRCSEAWF